MIWASLLRSHGPLGVLFGNDPTLAGEASSQDRLSNLDILGSHFVVEILKVYRPAIFL
jgi:hypothetical protein